jgi:hypothetical protein
MPNYRGYRIKKNTNGDNLNNKRCEASRHFGNKKMKYLKNKLMRLQQTVKMRTSEACIEEYINLRGVSNLEVT